MNKLTDLLKNNDLMFERLLGEEGKRTGITKEVHSNGNIRYRHKNPGVEDVPGTWISKDAAYTALLRSNQIQQYLSLDDPANTAPGADCLYVRGSNDNFLDLLVELEGDVTGITREEHHNGNIRYRHKNPGVEGVPGVWISKDVAYELLWSSALNPKIDLSKVDYSKPSLAEYDLEKPALPEWNYSAAAA